MIRTFLGVALSLGSLLAVSCHAGAGLALSGSGRTIKSAKDASPGPCDPNLPGIAQGGLAIPGPSMVCDFEPPGKYEIGFDENLQPASGDAEVVADAAHTGRHSLKINYKLPPSNAGLYIKPIPVEARQMPPDPWGVEFWCKGDAPHRIWFDLVLQESNGETWNLGARMRADGNVTEWHPVRMAFEWAKLVTWNRGDGVLDLKDLASLTLIMRAEGGQGEQKGTIWIDSLQLLDAAHAVQFRREGNFVVLNLEDAFNSDGVAWRANPSDGDFHTGDWEPRTLPAEFFPKTPEKSFHGVPFRMPPLDDGRDNHIRCNGQKLEGFPADSYSAIYFLATGKFGDQIGDLELHYSDGVTSSVALDISDWSRGAHRGDALAITFPFAFYGKTIDVRIPQIFLQSVRVDPARRLESIRLPMNDFLKVFAVTLYAGEHPPAAGAMIGRSVAEMDPRYFMPRSIDQDFRGPARPVGALGAYLEKRGHSYTLDIRTFNGFLTFASEALTLPQHQFGFDRFETQPPLFVLGGMQTEGKAKGPPRVDLLDSTCASYSCDAFSTATRENFHFKVTMSRACPAALYEIDSDSYFWHDPDRGGSTYASFADGAAEIRTVKAAKGAAVPVPSEPWILIWHTGRTGARAFDVPILLVLEKRPQKMVFQRSATEDAWDLAMRYEKKSCRALAMPLYGIRRLAVEETAQWAKHGGIPREVVAHCRAWAARLQEYPIALRQDFLVDEAAGKVSIRDQFDYVKLASEWEVAPERFAPLPPVALLAVRNGYPMALDARASYSGVDTFWGPLWGVKDDTTSYTIPIPRYTREMMTLCGVTGNSRASKAASEFERLLKGSLPENLATARFVSDTSGDVAMLRVFAPSRLILGRDDKITSYCQAVCENALKTTNLKLEKEPLTGQYYLMDDRFWARDASYDKEWDIGFILQGLWSYSYYCDDTEFLRRHWNRICGLYRYYRIVFDWTISSTWTMTTGEGANSDGTRIAWEGMLAMARMAKAVGDEETYRDAVIRSSREMMSLYASWFSCQWAADHDYIVQRGFRVPPEKAELRFVSDATWSEFITGDGPYTPNFFLVTHAFYIFNLADMLFLHDFGIDELRLRKWIFEIVPELHPNWCDGNALCADTKNYYGNDSTMAHIIARSLLFHQDIDEVHSFYRSATHHTRVLKEWYSPMGTAPLALAAMITGAAPLAIIPVQNFQVRENKYDAAARRQRIILESITGASDELRIRCWGKPPFRVSINDVPVSARYDAANDYAVIPVSVFARLAGAGETCTIEVQYP